MPHRRSSMLAAATFSLLALAPCAHAAQVTVSTSNGQQRLDYDAVAGETNRPTFTQPSANTVVVQDTVVLTTSGPCILSPDNKRASCTTNGPITRLDADLGDGDDTAVNELADYGTTESYDLIGRAGSDTLTGSDGGRDSLSGGPGTDVATGRGGDDTLADFDLNTGDGDGANVFDGGPGDDSVFGGTGFDTLTGGAGNDVMADEGTGGGATMSGGPDADRFERFIPIATSTAPPVSIDAGPGIDFVQYGYSFPDPVPAGTPGADVRLSADGPTTGNGMPSQNDTLTGIEDVQGTPQPDSLTGSAAPNRLSGGEGDDVLVGGGGLDLLDGSRGADRIDARDAGADRVRCSDATTGGEPGDAADVDSLDDVAFCPAAGAGLTVTQVPPQVVEVPGPVRLVDRSDPLLPPRPDTTAPDIGATKLPTSVKLSDLRGRKGLPCSIRSTDATVNRATCTLTGTARRGARVSAAGDLVVAERTASFTRTARLTLKLSRKYRSSVRKRAKLRLTVVVTDAAGNRATKRGTVRVR